MSMIPANVESYFARLNERLGDAEHFPFKRVRIGDWEPLQNRCHDNVDRWVIENQGCEAVRGWLIGASSGDGGKMYIAHSIVREGGDSYDITPLNPPDLRLQFLRHEGTQMEFDELKITWTGKFYPFYTDLLHESGEIRDEAEQYPYY